MKKRAKLIGTLTAFCASLCMMIVGVLSASQVGLNVTSSVSFEASGVYVKVKGEVLKGNDATEPTRAEEPEGSDYYYIGYSYDAVDEEQETDTQTTDYNDAPVGTSSNGTMTAWTIGNVEFSEEENIIRYSLTFTNYSEKDIQATITTNKDAFLQDTDVQGKVNIEETSSSLTIAGYDGETAQTGTYTITMKLTNFSSSFTNKSLTIDVNFEVSMPPTANYEYFNIENNAITGLSDTYKNLETKPEVLVVPGYAEGTNTPLSIADGISSSNPTFNGLASSTVILQDGLTSMGEYAFFDCSSLTSIEIPSSLTSIGDNAFFNCRGLTSIEIPSSVTSIGNSAFAECKGLTSIEIPSSVTSIGNYAIFNCSSLTSIEIPNSVTSIGDSAFQYCSGLTSIEIPNSVTSIGRSAFDGCSGLTSITFEENSKLASIGTNAFSDCSGLTSIEIPSGVTSIGVSAFSGCRSLSSITFEENSKLASIGDYAFSDCSGLTSVTIQNGVTSIGSEAFSYCRGLTSINLPSSVTSIGNSAFWGCSKLATITVQATTPPKLGSNNIPSNETNIYVPSGSVSTYQSASGWSRYSSKISAIQ